MTSLPATRTAALAAAAALMLCAPAAAQVPAPAAPAVRPAGEYRIARWTAVEGLPQNTVTDILQLPNGELWVATFGGLARFDGLGFHVVDMAADEGLPANRIVALAPAGPDAFWFLSQQGHLGKVQGGRAVPVLPPPLPAVDTLDFVVDRTGRVLCRPADGSVWMTDGAHAWRPVLAASRGMAGLRQLAVTDDGQAWAIRDDRLVRAMEGTPHEFVALPAGARSAFPRRGGGLWVALDSGISEMADGGIRRVDVRPPIERPVTYVRQGDERTLWVASLGDVSRLTRDADGILAPGVAATGPRGGLPRPLDAARRPRQPVAWHQRERALPGQPPEHSPVRFRVGIRGCPCPGARREWRCLRHQRMPGTGARGRFRCRREGAPEGRLRGPGRWRAGLLHFTRRGRGRRLGACRRVPLPDSALRPDRPQSPGRLAAGNRAHRGRP